VSDSSLRAAFEAWYEQHELASDVEKQLAHELAAHFGFQLSALAHERATWFWTRSISEVVADIGRSA
jgi:hypothetical protein